MSKFNWELVFFAWFIFSMNNKSKLNPIFLSVKRLETKYNIILATFDKISFSVICFFFSSLISNLSNFIKSLLLLLFNDIFNFDIFFASNNFCIKFWRTLKIEFLTKLLDSIKTSLYLDKIPMKYWYDLNTSLSLTFITMDEIAFKYAMINLS